MNQPEPGQQPPATGWHSPYPGHATGSYPSVGDHDYLTPPKNSYPVRNGVLVVTVVIAIAIAAVFLTRGKEDPAPDAVPTRTNVATTVQSNPATGLSAGDQARAIDQVLADSELGRDYLGAAINDINACRITSTMYSNLNAAISNRASLIARTDALVVSGIPEGASLKSRLRTLLSASHDADLAYLNWVQAAGTACPRTSDFGYQAIVNANTNAQTAKVAFLSEWNPVAARYGLPQRSNAEI